MIEEKCNKIIKKRNSFHHPGLKKNTLTVYLREYNFFYVFCINDNKENKRFINKLLRDNFFPYICPQFLLFILYFYLICFAFFFFSVCINQVH